MLSPQENESLCRVGAATPMGALLRQYWIPALISNELAEPDCPPMRLRLLGENLIAFRVTSGRVGVIQNACPHRGASLFFGRNEEEGLRCVYHGWKFDCEGNCVDMPSEPAESNFKNKVQATAYPTAERNGIVWIYMGPRRKPPPLPQIEPNLLPDGQYVVQKFLRECNWVQAMEGDLDTVHQSFLHIGHVSSDDAEPNSFDYFITKQRAARYDVVDTEIGTSYAAYRPVDDGQTYWRIGHFAMPFYSFIPTGNLGVQVLVRANVPVDDEHVMYWNMAARGPQVVPGLPNPFGRPMAREGAGRRGGMTPDYLPDTTDWLGKFRLAANRSNDYFLDREAQRSGESYTGIPGVIPQDAAVTESMGTVYDRSYEHLGTSDGMIIRTRRRLLQAAKALRDRGEIPAGVEDPDVYLIRSGGVVLPREVDWQQATQEKRRAGPARPV